MEKIIYHVSLNHKLRARNACGFEIKLEREKMSLSSFSPFFALKTLTDILVFLLIFKVLLTSFEIKIKINVKQDF